MRQRLQQFSRSTIILLLEAVAIAALLAFAFFIKPTSPSGIAQPSSPIKPQATTPSAAASRASSTDPRGITPGQAELVLELFTPQDSAHTQQLSDASIRQQIEQVMATSYVLSRCGLIDESIYRDNFRALMIYAERTGFAVNPTDAERKLREIAQAAKASYQLLYRRVTCDNKSLTRIRTQLIAWQNAYLNQ